MSKAKDFIREHVALAVSAASAGNWPSHRFRFGNLPLVLQTSTSSIASVLIPIIEHARENAPGNDVARIVAVDADQCDFPAPPEVWPFETETMDGRLRLCWRPEDRVAMVTDESRGIWHLFNFETRSGLYWVRSCKGLPYWEYGSPLRHFIQWSAMAQASSLSMVHGAALSVGGCGVLLAGPGGSGKSTLTAAAVKSGWMTTGDDFVLIDINPPTVMTHPLYDIMKLTGMAEERFADEVKLAINPCRKEGEKALIPLSTITGSQFVDALQVSHIVVVSLSGKTHSEVTPASMFEVIAALAPSTMKVLRTGLKETHTFCCELAHQLPAVKLISGRDPMEALACLRQFLESNRR